VYIGGGYAVEARGFNYGVVKTKVSRRTWTHWYQCPYIDYITTAPTEPLPSQEEPVPPPVSEHNADTARLLQYRKGAKMLRGEDVLQVQNRLIKLGFDPGKADGVYGPSTEKAVKMFQEAPNLEIDGIVGPITRTKLAKD
jgi:peptidoglycan hydrolase-like protein with peptidoglycan-binding domain